MGRLTKHQKAVAEKFDAEKPYTLDKASSLVKDCSTTKFDASVDLAVRLGVDPRKANQMVRGTVSLPHGTGKDVKVLVLCPPDKDQEALDAGADYVGLDEYVAKIKGGWTDVDVIITTPQVMGKVGALGRVLGPRGLMPNPKSGTVTMDVAKAVTDVKAGKIDFKVDKFGIIHASVGKVSFEASKIEENANELISTLVKLKPASAKGSYIKSIIMSSTMGPGIKKDLQINELKQLLEDNSVVYLTDASGLNSEQTTTLRRACFKKDVSVRVVKNTLLRRAMDASEGTDYSELYEVLSGQTALLLGNVGNVPAKLLKDFRKKHSMPLLKAAYVEEACYLGDNQIDVLTNVKSKDELVADVIALLQSPMKNVVGALKSSGNTVSGLVKALQERG